jgi:tape measure domain-containing protein
MARAELKTVVSADTSQFSTSIRKATGQAAAMGRKVGGAMTSAGSAMGKAALSAGAVGAGLAAAAASAALFKGVKAAAQIQQMGIAFEVMTGSAQKGQKVLDDLKAYGAATPYEFPALAKGGQTLLAFGIQAEKILPTIKMLGDVAAGDAQKMESLALVFGQISSAGKLTGGDLLQLIGAGFNPLQQMAERTGVSMTELRKQMEAGAFSAEMVAEEFRLATSEGGRFYGMTEKQSKTFNGKMSTLADSINVALEKMGQPIMESMVPYLGQASAIIDYMSPIMADLGSQIAAKMPDIVKGLGNAADFSFRLYQHFQNAFAVSLEGMKTLGNAQFWSAIGTLLSSAFKDSVNFLKAGIESAVAMLTVGALELPAIIWDTFKFLVDGKFWTNIGDQLVSAAMRFGETFARILTDLTMKLAKLDFAALKDSVQNLMESGKANTSGYTFGVGQSTSESFARIKKAGSDAFANSEPVYETEDSKAAAAEILSGIGKSVAAAGSKPIVSLVDAIKDKVASSQPKAEPEKAESAASDRKRVYGESVNATGRVFGQGANATGRAFGSVGAKMGTNAFSADRERLGLAEGLGGASGRWAGTQGGGLATGLQTGGLGEKRKLRTSKDDRDAKKGQSVQEKQLDTLTEIKTGINQALTVA